MVILAETLLVQLGEGPVQRVGDDFKKQVVWVGLGELLALFDHNSEEIVLRSRGIESPSTNRRGLHPVLRPCWHKPERLNDLGHLSVVQEFGSDQI